jgi:hypothetical protein
VNRAHYDAVFAQIDDEDSLHGKGHETVRTDADGRLVRDIYWILFGGSPSELGGDRLTRSQVVDDNAVFDFTVRSVGTSTAAATAESEKVQAQLIGWTPQIDGRRCRPVKFSGADKVRPDNSVKPPLFYVDDEFELRSFFMRADS